MPAPFKRLNRAQFTELLFKFPFTRKINAVHMHHTWKPNRDQYRGHDTIVAMWRYHTQTNHWSDIAQHVTIDPFGGIWLGRDWNRPPASAKGHNGNAQAGPFMFEMIGDFDDGMDPFDGEQRISALEVIAGVQQRFGLAPGTLQLHNMMSNKTCPGSGIDYQTVLDDVQKLHQRMSGVMRGVPTVDDGPFPHERQEAPFVKEAIEDLQRGSGAPFDPPDAEPCQHDGHGEYLERTAGERASGLTADELQAMRPHVVNLRMGAFSAGGEWTSAATDVDAIFDDHLPAALKRARAKEQPLRLMFYAHGGLTSEAAGLAAAHQRIDWWLQNDIYPIHFVWETGLAETLAQVLVGRQQGRAARGMLTDRLFDAGIERVARAVGGGKVWSAMKAGARQASAPDLLADRGGGGSASAGGAWYVAARLAAFCKSHGDAIEVHAAGHSAGAIFHAHFLPCALGLGVPRVHSLHLLAPALRVDLFKQQLAPLVGEAGGIASLAMYTMTDSYERKDRCAMLYGKSLLYLIHHALEAEADAPILGLERCVRADPDLRTLFGIGASAGKRVADVVWADNGLDQGTSASRSRTHQGFDDDPATMGSVVRRVLGKAAADRIVELPAQAARGGDPWHAPALDPAIDRAIDGADEWVRPPAPPRYGQDATAFVAPPEAVDAAAPSPLWPAGGRRLALCVGIDRYAAAPLGGCVNDAHAWVNALGRLGFGGARTLLDQQATRAAIVDQLHALVGGSRAGDVIVFHYSGHGTSVPDYDGDEAGGDTPGFDEALVPYDGDDGELLVDDDLRVLFGALPDGVNLTCFFDCCFSGTITRMGLATRPRGRSPGRRLRAIQPPPQMMARYLAKRSGMALAGARADDIAGMRDVSFSACRSDEKAGESGGAGDFTRAAMQVLADGVGGMSNHQFADRVTRLVAAAERQHVELLSSDSHRHLPFLQAAQGQLAPYRRSAPGFAPAYGEPAWHA